MTNSFRTLAHLIRFLMQRAALAFFILTAVGLTAATGMAATGQWHWFDLPLSWNGAPVPQAGMYAQIALTVFAVCLCFFLPSAYRTMQLENAHRDFSVNMTDITRAYAAVHAADRGDVFRFSTEFDAVRERIAYLRDHPDLGSLEPALLEVAAQMSHISKELAEVYSDERVARARSFLEQRQYEVDQFNTRLDHAKAVSSEFKHWLTNVELEESVAAAQLDRLRAEMREVLPELGLQTIVTTDNTVTKMMPKAAE
ncbi:MULTISPECIES: DNA repair protein [Roseobacteraceae]|uniref:DNA repair protein n=1 Tax=Pseudosulfitobacter pseudonitzschiae TaxID=1402135 RepID=A0A221K1C6_9RHOB|nr:MULTISPECIES: DNA repair protein [Roseobacteraceae]ASM72627.1 DNA repair protein [Pseudosulfitobacter pseudonitzschiae]